MSAKSTKHVAILGGGLQGACLAVVLAARGIKVTIFDKNDALLTRAAIVNEGKIHLGYIYAGDRSLTTARMMQRGALSFAPFFARYLGVSPDSIQTSAPAHYVVHRQTQLSVAGVAQHLKATHDLAIEAAIGRERAYFGVDLSEPPRQLSAAECDLSFDPGSVLAAFSTPERAVQPTAIADFLRSHLDNSGMVEIRLQHTVRSVDLDGGRPAVVCYGPDGQQREAFDEIVNALWDGRIAIDAALGLHPQRPWLHRFKYGVRMTLPQQAALPPSATFLFGPFGEAVSFAGGSIFLTWYPTCMVAATTKLEPPNYPALPDEPLRSSVLTSTYECLSEMVLGLRDVPEECVRDAVVKGGVIVAWGSSDIEDPKSELHQRFEIGLTTVGRYHSLDPGKYTLAPYFAEVCAARILSM